jgi:hypothetical protein
VSSITQFIRVSQESSIYFQQDYFDHLRRAHNIMFRCRTSV